MATYVVRTNVPNVKGFTFSLIKLPTTTTTTPPPTTGQLWPRGKK